MAMQIETCRFGSVEVEASDAIHFPAGVLGMKNCRDWVLLADARNELLGWLQSMDRPEIALAVVSPRRFVPDYQIRVARRDLTVLRLADVQEAQVLVIVGKTERSISLNLKAPLVFNLETQRGAQVVAKDEYPVQHELPEQGSALKKSA